MKVQIISAPSILGLQSDGVDRLAEAFLQDGLKQRVKSDYPVVHVPVLNHQRSPVRDITTQCLNAKAIKDFSIGLGVALLKVIEEDRFPLVLGGDCSILLGIMPALKVKMACGLIFIDAHADFYQPPKSLTGEVADMDLAIVTGRGPELLTNINNLKPYVLDKNVIHIGQRDQEETEKYGSEDIRKTSIACYGLNEIRQYGIRQTARKIHDHITTLEVDQLWLHFDTDVLSDEINPAVDYRLPGGLEFEEVIFLIGGLLATGKVTGVSVTIYNPSLDVEGQIGKRIVGCLAKAIAGQ